jgi:hypothetical protein
MLRLRQREMTEVMSNNIHDMPEVSVREKLIDRISQSARERGVEPHLRDFLNKRGMLGTTTRKFSETKHTE